MKRDERGGWRIFWVQGGRRRNTRVRTEREARIFHARMTLLEEEGGAESPTLAAFWPTFLESLHGLSRNRQIALASAGTKWWLPALGQTPLNEIRVSDVNRVLKAAGEQGRASITVRGTIWPALAKCLDLAVADGRLPANHLRGKVAMPRSTPARERKPFQDADEFDAVLAQLLRRNLHHAALFVLLADTGMRPSEALALRCGDIDLQRRRVRGGVHRVVRNGAVTLDTKNARTRAVALTPRATQALARLVNAGEPRDWLFPAKRMDGPMPVSTFTQALRVACKRAGVPVRTAYALRHTFASRVAILPGVMQTELAELLGDTDLRSVRGYLHYAENRTAHVAELLHQDGLGSPELDIDPRDVEYPGRVRIRKAIEAFEGREFTILEVCEATTLSTKAVRDYLRRGLADGTIEARGVRQIPGRPGKPPRLFRRASQPAAPVAS